MKENVILQITGLHSQDNENDSIEMINTGIHVFRDGRHYIKYQESIEEGLVCDNLIKVSKNEVEVIRKGSVSTTMVFTVGQKNVSYYETPFGVVTMGIYTSELEIVEESDSIIIDIIYSLDMNNEHVSDCSISIKISEAQ